MKKLLAILMAMAMLFTFTACGGNGEEETTTNPEVTTEAPVNGKDEVTEEAIEGETEKETEVVSEVVTNDEGETEIVSEVVTKEEKTTVKNEKPESTTKKETSSVPQTKAEIIDYCAKALDRVKSEKAGYTKHAFMEVKGDVAGVPKWIVSVLSNDKTTTMAKGSNNKDDFPAAGFEWSCKLRPQDVKDATIKVNGTTYEIMIKLGTEKNPGKGTASSYGRAVSVIDAADAAGMFPGLKEVTMNYHDGYIHAKIDSTTGRVTYAQISAAADASATIVALKVQGNDITSTETYTNFVW